MSMKIWAHRGCSQCNPENTITAFEKAMNIPGLAGIELDIQLTSDGEMVVIHDERVDRTTDGIGFVRDMSLKEIRSLHIHNGFGPAEKIPTMREVLELLKPGLKKYQEMQEDGGLDGANILDQGLRLNIELKTGNYSYPGIEARIVDMVREFDVEDAIVYSSFYAETLVRVHKLAPDAEIGVLDSRVSDCLYKAMGLEQTFGTGNGQNNTWEPRKTVESEKRLALHPNGGRIDLAAERLTGRTVRAWFGGHLYPEKPTGGKMDLQRLEDMGITDVFLNEPEKYL